MKCLKIQFTTLNLLMTTHRDITPEEREQLSVAIREVLQENPHLKQRIISMLSDPRNEDTYDTWEYGTEPLPGDNTWHSN
jgi:hypothetical protein